MPEHVKMWSFLPQPTFVFPKYNPSCLLYKKRLSVKGGGLSRTTFTNDDESILTGPPVFFILFNQKTINFLLKVNKFHLLLKQFPLCSKIM